MTQPGPDIAVSPALGYLLKQAAVTLRGAMDSVLRPHGLTVPQYACLDLLGRNPGSSGSDLARGAFTTRQTMHEILRTLERQGLVDRSEPERGRTQPAYLSAAGRRLLRTADRAVDGVQARMLAPLTPDQQEQMGEALARCIAALATDDPSSDQ
jgi:DNA-binding MarR family transcriptional regulator